MGEESIQEQNYLFYKKLIDPMIKKQFPAFESRIAVGVVGEGSDCFGYDDEISRDHDFGIGVCLWVTDEDWSVIGSSLQTCYQATLREWYDLYPDTKNNNLCTRLQARRGVRKICEFYEMILGFRIDPSNPTIKRSSWFYTDEWKFATATNGRVFRDELGQFTKIRKILLGYYTDQIWRMRLVNELHEFSAAMQSNYARCMARGDLIAASYCRTKSIDSAMNIVFLLNRIFAPYYKWKFRAMKEIDGTKKLLLLLEQAVRMQPELNCWKNYKYDSRQINIHDDLLIKFEQIATLLVDMLYKQELITNHEVFLEAHCDIIASGIRS